VSTTIDPGALPWERMADGRAWRLKNGKHFPKDPKEAVLAAGRAAEGMGKAVRTMIDIQQPHVYVWVQFADHALRRGEPCICGEVRFVRLHPEFVRCTACDRVAVLSAMAPGRKPPRPQASLEAYTEIIIFKRRRLGDGSKEVAYGHALDACGRRVLITVQLPLQDGERIAGPLRSPRDEDDLAAYRHTVHWWHAGPFAKGLDLEALGGRSIDGSDT
jgi:hypothetical protein